MSLAVSASACGLAEEAGARSAKRSAGSVSGRRRVSRVQSGRGSLFEKEGDTVAGDDLARDEDERGAHRGEIRHDLQIREARGGEDAEHLVEPVSSGRE